MSTGRPADPPPSPIPGHVRQQQHGDVLRITIDNHRRMNASTLEIFAQRAAAMTLLDSDESLRAGLFQAR